MYTYNSLFKYLKKKSITIKFNNKFNLDKKFYGVSSLKNSKINYISFYNDAKLKNFLKNNISSACFIVNEDAHMLPPSCDALIVEDPYLAYAQTTNFLNPDQISNKLISNNSTISDNVIFSNNVEIQDFVIIKKNVEIGDGVIISSNSVIGPNVIIDKNTIIKSNCTISNCKIGSNCLIQSGAVIGDIGFGFTPKEKIEIKHTGDVIIGNNVYIGSNTTIDRAALDSTIINDNVRIDNLVQIAHNVIIGKNTIIAAQAGVAGSSIIGQNCLIGGQSGINGHISIGNNVKIAGKSGVTKSLNDNSIVAGFPAVDINKWRKNFVNQFKK